VRTKVALEALKEKPRLMLLEKPLSFPFDPNLKKFVAAAKKQKTIVLVGYDHAVAKSINRVAELLKKKSIGEPLTLDVEFREHWQGIFKAHPGFPVRKIHTLAIGSVVAVHPENILTRFTYGSIWRKSPASEHGRSSRHFSK
jgi:predicted dehydrogenase